MPGISSLPCPIHHTWRVSFHRSVLHVNMASLYFCIVLMTIGGGSSCFVTARSDNCGNYFHDGHSLSTTSFQNCFRQDTAPAFNRTDVFTASTNIILLHFQTVSTLTLLFQRVPVQNMRDWNVQVIPSANNISPLLSMILRNEFIVFKWNVWTILIMNWLSLKCHPQISFTR